MKTDGQSSQNLLSDVLGNGSLKDGPQGSDDQRRAGDHWNPSRHIDALKNADQKAVGPKTVGPRVFGRKSGDQKQADGRFHKIHQNAVLKSADPKDAGHWSVGRCSPFQNDLPSCRSDRDAWVVIHHETDVDHVNLSRCQKRKGGGDRIVSSLQGWL